MSAVTSSISSLPLPNDIALAVGAVVVAGLLLPWVRAIATVSGVAFAGRRSVQRHCGPAGAPPGTWVELGRRFPARRQPRLDRRGAAPRRRRRLGPSGCARSGCTATGPGGRARLVRPAPTTETAPGAVVRAVAGRAPTTPPDPTAGMAPFPWTPPRRQERAATPRATRPMGARDRGHDLRCRRRRGRSRSGRGRRRRCGQGARPRARHHHLSRKPQPSALGRLPRLCRQRFERPPGGGVPGEPARPAECTPGQAVAEHLVTEHPLERPGQVFHVHEEP